jgi:hypothetical protein
VDVQLGHQVDAVILDRFHADLEHLSDGALLVCPSATSCSRSLVF